MVRVAATNHRDVQRDVRRHHQGAPELLGELRIERADPLRDRVEVVRDERTTREIERDLDERGYLLPGIGDAGDRLYDTLGA